MYFNRIIVNFLLIPPPPLLKRDVEANFYGTVKVQKIAVIAV
jgi:hypothetical protein